MADTTVHGLGLLRGVDVESATSYSKTLIYSEELLRSAGFFWMAAETDARERGVSVEDYLNNLNTLLENSAHLTMCLIEII
jgi:hypothetical protein